MYLLNPERSGFQGNKDNLTMQVLNLNFLIYTIIRDDLLSKNYQIYLVTGSV